MNTDNGNNSHGNGVAATSPKGGGDMLWKRLGSLGLVAAGLPRWRDFGRSFLSFGCCAVGSRSQCVVTVCGPACSCNGAGAWHPANGG